MTETRCALTDLMVSACAHCRGDRDPAPTDDVVIVRTVTAVHTSRCVLDGGHPIEPGDRIGLAYATDGDGKPADHLGWACPACTGGAS